MPVVRLLLARYTYTYASPVAQRVSGRPIVGGKSAQHQRKLSTVRAIPSGYEKHLARTCWWWVCGECGLALRRRPHLDAAHEAPTRRQCQGPFVQVLLEVIVCAVSSSSELELDRPPARPPCCQPHVGLELSDCWSRGLGKGVRVCVIRSPNHWQTGP
ncbi:hypothetical protein PYCCODRAFT_656166 [Trametes coccinea BRFM310]|uniref:Uncharacterized protein n=1 Tax=Trametes coccinea (strain BRFM310) TaxID=1353009 RepID=A0A1Y2IKH4_TRAC3|nr:hypothetical protein PYCCODRAFT_656166 [Trametes coccinea BRFM310]